MRRRALTICAVTISVLLLYCVFLISPAQYTKFSWNLSTPDEAIKVEDESLELPSTDEPPEATSILPSDYEADSVATTSPITLESTMIDTPAPPIPTDKIVVMGKLQEENTDWVSEFLPDWNNAIYIVDNTTLPLSTAQNKGKEANAYLTYIIQHYHDLPSTIAFLHSHRQGYPEAWHTDATDHDAVKMLQNLNIAFVQEHGYANLRCLWEPGCPDELQPFRQPCKRDEDGRCTEHAFADMWKVLFEGIETPKVVATPCCAQFAVSREQIWKRPLSDYERYHEWLMSTDLPDDISGRVFEYLWHIIFGRDPV